MSCFRGGTCLDSLWFFSGRKLGQYADQELLKSLFQNKTPDLRLKYIDPKGKILLKKETKQKKKKRYKKQKTASPGVEPGLSARSSNYLTTAPQ